MGNDIGGVTLVLRQLTNPKGLKLMFNHANFVDSIRNTPCVNLLTPPQGQKLWQNWSRPKQNDFQSDLRTLALKT